MSTLGPIAKREHELRANKKNARKAQDDEEDISDSVAKRINARIRESTSDEIEGQVEVGQGEVREQKLNELVDRFHEEENFACKRMICVPNLSELHKRVDRSKEGAIEPTSTLRDEFGNSIYEFKLDLLSNIPLLEKRVISTYQAHRSHPCSS